MRVHKPEAFETFHECEVEQLSPGDCVKLIPVEDLAAEIVAKIVKPVGDHFLVEVIFGSADIHVKDNAFINPGQIIDTVSIHHDV